MPGAAGFFSHERCKKCNIYDNSLSHGRCGTCHSLLSCDECKKYLEPFIAQKRFGGTSGLPAQSSVSRCGTLLGINYLGKDLWSVITKIIPVMYHNLNYDFVYPGLYWREKYSNILSKLCNKPSKKSLKKMKILLS